MDLLAPGTPACLRICEDAARGVFIEGLRDVEVDSGDSNDHLWSQPLQPPLGPHPECCRELYWVHNQSGGLCASHL